ncbi:bacteriocin maturation radical SAM 1 family protein [Burkholderia thailandensis 34]|uniref:RiPP maturation radical SAM C-methyltransferase n=1 Tax=Burkholderia thailandensis TaxID=57975 RepID=UPI0005DA4FAF|nr:RiPP maturation radical SAM C-methyltransferase [Burkholderia thailandensis]AJY31402.1 bacteriocin maturation radical SAM 1 family protein [Burkholderia thailandensis 34]PNE78164.1 RiPP maturation radical SAM protein 1 [Burkholderia thailandensis]
MTAASGGGASPERPSRKVLLISPPWRLGNWPSLALGTLKSHLRRHGIDVDTRHLHFDVAVRLGWSRYQEIASGWELGEALYFALDAPDEADAILARSAKAMRANGQALHAAWAERPLLDEVEMATLGALGNLDLRRYDLVGFSVGALQLAASVFLGHLFKCRAPHLRVIFGGGSVLGEPGLRLLQQLPWLDAVVDGEGELAMAALSSIPNWDDAELEAVPNLYYRRADGSVARTVTRVLATLDDTLPPDMGEFYSAARAAGFPAAELILPVEASRGCHWEHRKTDGQLRGCTFCGLYRNSPNYRERHLDTVMAHIRDGVHRSRTLALGFVDAYLPSAYAKALLRRLASEPLDVTLFCEMRCDLDAETAALLAAAGARHVQLGVEAFDTKLLSQMAKGVRMIDNVSSIKVCEEFGVPYQYNLITYFPGADRRAVDRMANLLPALAGFKPPSLAHFYLDRSSRIFADWHRDELAARNVDHSPLPFLPSALAAARITQVVPFDTLDRDALCEEWAAVEREVTRWRTRHQQAQAEGVVQLLSWRDAGSALIVSDERGDEPLAIELEGVAREVLLACDRLVRKRDLCERVRGLDESTLHTVLQRLNDQKLVVQEGAWVIALPVRARLPNGAARERAASGMRQAKTIHIAPV